MFNLQGSLFDLSHVSDGPSGSENVNSDSQVRIWCPQLVQEGSWQHISVVFAKSGMLKNSSVALHLNGAHISTHKVCKKNKIINSIFLHYLSHRGIMPI